MKKKALVMLLAAMMVLSLTGCGVVFDMGARINKKGAGKMTVSVGYSKDIIDGLNEMDDSADVSLDELTPFTYNGETYYGVTESCSFKKASQLEDILTSNESADNTATSSDDRLFDQVYASGDTFIAYPNKGGVESSTDTSDIETQYEIDENTDLGVYMDLSITFDKPIKTTNGKLSADKKTVTWSLEQLSAGKKLYAYTTKSRSSAKVNIRNKKTYKKSVVIKKTSGKGSLYLDGKRINSGKKVTKAGSHKLVVVSQNGKRVAYKFKIKK